jgi:hypothetical protein
MVDAIKPKWAARVSPALIKRLYESDARGVLDDELLDDVGMRLYMRCKSIVVVHDLVHTGRLPCPGCGEIVIRGSQLKCAKCGWELPWSDYWVTFRHNEFAYDVFVSDFMADWEKARTARQKMLAIDRVIHRWHNDTKQKRERFGVGRPAGVNLIEGSRQQVIAFLDALTSSGELHSAHDESWRHYLATLNTDANARQR